MSGMVEENYENTNQPDSESRFEPGTSELQTTNANYSMANLRCKTRLYRNFLMCIKQNVFFPVEQSHKRSLFTHSYMFRFGLPIQKREYIEILYW
jgi:hypothetical protein